jgi:hypothetical protein
MAHPGWAREEALKQAPVKLWSHPARSLPGLCAYLIAVTSFSIPQGPVFMEK